MKELLSKENSSLISICGSRDCNLTEPRQFPTYSIIFIKTGSGNYHADFGKFPFEGPMLLFSTPLQTINLLSKESVDYSVLQFHGDFYCIEYHKDQVSCNGLLFNNIYIEPSVKLEKAQAVMFSQLLTDIEKELSKTKPDEFVLISYLQLFLAKASSVKMESIESEKSNLQKDEKMEQLIRLIEENYLTLHKPSNYAALLAMSPNNLSKRSFRYFRKSPSALIQERIILEAKKKLHLTRMSIKEISYLMNFEDEYYFSRFFKKFTRVSPQQFRNGTGISIVANVGT